MMIPPSGDGEIKLSCFCPVIGWNQCVKCVAPFEIAQFFMALATGFATEISNGAPSSIVFFRER